MLRRVFSAILKPVWIALLAFGFEKGSNLRAQPSFLTIGYFEDIKLPPDVLDAYNLQNVYLFRQIGQSLVELDFSGNVSPSVAKSWLFSVDQKSIAFKLNENIFFHDLSQLTAEDVVYSLEKIRVSRFNPISHYLERIESIRATNRFEVEVKLKKPWFGFLHALTSGLVPIFSKSFHMKEGKFLGSGPYKLNFSEGNWVLEPFEQYFGPYSPQNTAFRIVRKPESGLQPDVLFYGKMQESHRGKFNEVVADSFMGYYFFVNPNSKSWRRKADRLMLLKALLESKKLMMNDRLQDLKHVLPRGMLGYDPSSVAYKNLMNQMKEVDPRNLQKKKIIIGSYLELPRFELLQKAVKERYGIELTSRVFDEKDYLSRLSEDKIDIIAIGWNSIFSHPDAAFYPFVQMNLKLADPKISTYLDQIEVAYTQTTQFSLYSEISKILIEDAHILPHSQLNVVTYARKDLFIPRFRYRYGLQLSEIERRVVN